MGLAFAPPERVAVVLAGPRPRRTPRTVVVAPGLLDRLDTHRLALAVRTAALGLSRVLRAGA